MLLQRRLFSTVVYQGQIAYVATCPELGVTSQGKTEEKALKNLEEAVELYLADAGLQTSLSTHPAALSNPSSRRPKTWTKPC